MNEITHIHLGRTAFTIAVDAHRALRAYLRDIEAQTGDNKEVTEEVESRMAELLAERGIKGDKVILLGDVDYLKAQLGEPGDFTDDDDNAPAHKPAKPAADDHESPGKRLFRDTDHGMVAGVAAGLGAYFKLDPILFRILFIVLTLSGGAGIVVYLVLWLLVPPVKSGSDRLRLNGKPVTVENIKETVARADIPGAANHVAKGLEKVLRGIAKVVLGVIGVAFIVAGIGVLLGAATAAAFAFAHGYQLGGTVLFPVGTSEQVAAVCACVLAGMVGVLAILAGRAMIRRKMAMPGWLLAAFVAVFVAAGGVGVATGVQSITPVRTRYQSLMHTETRQLAPFKSGTVELGNVDFLLIQSPDYKLDIQSFGQVDTRQITATVKDGKLSIDAGNLKHRTTCTTFCPYGLVDTRVVIYWPQQNGLTINGSYYPGSEDVQQEAPSNVSVPAVPDFKQD
ncbi:MAG TPA: PspC domain-containing protein [Candidatus Saccharimonadales bacterium]|nr:PspC domain-containing protein [Candidatus Saccharimonadales bacterium]